MNYRKTFKRITLIAWSTIAVILFMWSIALNPAEAGSLFNPAVNYAVGNRPTSVAIGDLNGDGDPDLAVARNYSRTGGIGTVSVLLGNGDGTFQSAVNYGAGNQPTSVAIGYQHVSMWMKSKKIAKRLYCDHGAGVGILIGNRML